MIVFVILFIGEAAVTYMLPVVEVHVVDHCNHTCRWCHNYSPTSPKREYKAEEYFDGLDLLFSNNIRVNLISLMGGEPFLHSDLIGFADDIVARYKRPLVLTSNGFWLNEDNIRIYKDLWPSLRLLKISRYPAIENRLGGEANILAMSNMIKRYNPNIHIEWPDKFTFNELKFFQEPRDVEIFCGNSTCIALVNLPDGPALGHCGAGAYAHLAPEGALSEAFLGSKHMFYPLREFEMHSFMLWHRRYPLDACAYCNFSQLSRSVRWKPASDRGLFVKEYEEEFERRQCMYLLATEEKDLLNKKAAALMRRNAAHAEFVNSLGVYSYNVGDTEHARQLFDTVLTHCPDNRDARRSLKVLADKRSAA